MTYLAGAVTAVAAAGPTLLFQTTWGGPNSDQGSGVAVAGS